MKTMDDGLWVDGVILENIFLRVPTEPAFELATIVEEEGEVLPSLVLLARMKRRILTRKPADDNPTKKVKFRAYQAEN